MTIKYKKESHSFRNEEDIINFGVYKGTSIGEIMRKDPEYINWCIKKFKGFKLWKKLNTKFEEIKNEVK